MELSIIIVNYNTTQHLRKCLESIKIFLKMEEMEIIVADNNSTDREIDNINSEFPNVKFFMRKINDGFAGGCNAAVRESTGKYLLFLNPDVKLIDNSIEKLLKYVDENENVGIVSGLLVDRNSLPMYSYNKFPNLSWEISHLVGKGYDQKIKELLNRKELQEGEPFEVDWFHGAFLLLRRIDFYTVGGFNEKYFMYYEDVEICYDFKKKLNKKIICFPKARIYHHTQSSLKDEKLDNIFSFHMHRGKILFIKNYYFLKRFALHYTGILSITIRIIILPFWSKYNNLKKEKFKQLTKILKLYFSKSYLESSKFEYIKL